MLTVYQLKSTLTSIRFDRVVEVLDLRLGRAVERVQQVAEFLAVGERDADHFAAVLMGRLYRPRAEWKTSNAIMRGIVM